MVELTTLWLPILVSAVFVFAASSIIHMVLPIHKADYKKLAGEEHVLAAMREQGVSTGSYVFPHAKAMKDMGTPEMIEKLNQGQVGFTTVVPNGPMAMGKSLAQWFVFSIVISVFTGYIATLSLKTGTDSMTVFGLTGTVAVFCYGVTDITSSIWKGVAWTVAAKFVFDGIVYGLVTAAAFAWLWPAA